MLTTRPSVENALTAVGGCVGTRTSEWFECVRIRLNELTQSWLTRVAVEGGVVNMLPFVPLDYSHIYVIFMCAT